ncbi:hypothetical protein SPX_02760 [Sporomusa paucivorans]
MSNEEKKNPGAASGDDTSALFVSARKKQLAEQEVQRKAAEEEAKRKAAEEEVRRLEAEVAERKRQAEEEAIRIAEEARAQKAEAAANPDAILGPPPAEQEGKGAGLPQMPKISIPRPDISPAAMEKITGNPKRLKIIGAAVVVLMAVLFFAWGGGEEAQGDPGDTNNAAKAVAVDTVIDVNAPFNDQKTLSTSGIIIHYPSSIFTVQSSTASELVLSAGDDAHAMLIISIADTPTAKYLANKDMVIPVLEANNKAKVAGLLNTVSEPAVLSQKVVNPSGNVWRYLTTATFKDDTGQEMYMYWWTGVWYKNKQSYVSEYAFICKTSLAVKYLPLVEKIWDKKTTVK